MRKKELRGRLTVFGIILIVPFIVITAILIYQMNQVAGLYDQIVQNITRANTYNTVFKEDMDAVMYQMVARSLTKDEVEEELGMKSPDELIENATATFSELWEKTPSDAAKQRLTSILKLLDTLSARADEINSTVKTSGHYDENMMRLDTDIRIITELIQERISEYIYYESVSMETMRTEIDQRRKGIIRVAIVAVLGTFLAVVLLVVQITKLFESIRIEQQNSRNLELRLLQAQINPHFLYNTLDNIVWLSEDERKEDVASIVTSLSRFFRTTLSGGRDFISLRQELSHVEAYLEIQQFRYRDILSYRIDVPEDLKNLLIIKLALQPVVENALYHGIKNKRGMGEIQIRAEEKDEKDLLLIVEDDGIGMDAESLEHLRGIIAGEIRPAEDNSGFGMSNVAERLRLNYGEKAAIFVDSEYGRGTKVQILIPKMEETE